VRGADDEGSAAKRVRDADTHLFSADARVDDLAYRLIIVLRSARWKVSDMTDCPRLDSVPTVSVISIIIRRSVRNASEESYHYRRCAKQHSTIKRRPPIRLGCRSERI
jgi:hypothetical protein